MKPEISTIDLANGVVFSGFTIPALATRRMETDIELGEGQTFLIGGLLDDRVTESLSKVPGLSHIPILGALFKSRSENKIEDRTARDGDARDHLSVLSDGCKTDAAHAQRVSARRTLANPLR